MLGQDDGRCGPRLIHCRARQHHGQADDHATGAPGAVKVPGAGPGHDPDGNGCRGGRRRRAAPCGVPEFGHSVWPGLLPSRSYSLMSPPRTSRRLIGSWGRAGDGVVGLRRPELAAATGVPSVVVGLVLSRIECRWRSPKISIWWLPRPGRLVRAVRRKRSRGTAGGIVTALTPVLGQRPPGRRPGRPSTHRRRRGRRGVLRGTRRHTVPGGAGAGLRSSTSGSAGRRRRREVAVRMAMVTASVFGRPERAFCHRLQRLRPTMAAAGRARARPAGRGAGVRCRIPSAGPRPGPQNPRFDGTQRLPPEAPDRCQASHQAYSVNPPGTRGYAVERLDCPGTAAALVRRQHC